VKPLTDKGMKSMMPLFVESTSPSDHKCGSCFMRIERKGEERGECTVVDVPIHMKDGVCSYWAKGDASELKDIHPARMDAATSGYEEFGGPVQCGTCVYYDKEVCRLWMGLVKEAQCCMSWTKGETDGELLRENTDSTD